MKIRRFWMCVALTSGLAFLAQSGARADECKLVQLASLPLTTSAEGDLLIPIMIADTPRTMILELADAYSAISDATATQLSLRRRALPEAISGTTIDGQSVTDLARSPVVQLGTLRANDFEFFVVPNMRHTPALDGVLGLDLLRGQDVELDLSHDKLNLFSRDHCSGKVVYWSSSSSVAAIPLAFQKTGHMQVKMLLDDKPVVVGITTDGPSFTGMNDARRLFGLDEHSPKVQPIPDKRTPGGEAIYNYPFGALAAEGLIVGSPAILIYGEEPGPECDARLHIEHRNGKTETYRCYGGADVFLGLSVLRRLRLYFAFGEKMLYATAADAK